MKRNIIARWSLAAVIAVTLGAAVAADAQSRAAGIPANATARAYGGWTCNDGYVTRAQSCIKVAEASDAEIKQHLIDASIASYAGSCPCPYNTDRAGRRCGARSAHSRPGGASPLCYATDLTDEAVKKFRTRYSAKR